MIDSLKCLTKDNKASEELTPMLFDLSLYVVSSLYMFPVFRAEIETAELNDCVMAFIIILSMRDLLDRYVTIFDQY